MCEFCSRYLWISHLVFFSQPKNRVLHGFPKLVRVASRSFDAKKPASQRPLAAQLPAVARTTGETSNPISSQGANCGVRTPPRGTRLGATPAEALDDAASVAATMKYMVFHALACHLSFVSSALCMTYIYVHVFFALAGLVFSLYLGSAWYDRMLTSHVTKKVRKHIAASTAKND